MSWYKERLAKAELQQLALLAWKEEKLHGLAADYSNKSVLLPINYELNSSGERGFLRRSNDQNKVTMCFTVIDMHDQNDYDKIKAYLMELKGIVEVKSYHLPKKLCVSFDPGLTGLEYIVYGISKLGYHYINRG